MNKTHKILLFSCFLLTNIIQTYSQNIGGDSLVFEKGGILFQGKHYSKPNEIAPILLKNENQEINSLFEKYKSNRGAANVFGFIGGFGIGYPIGGLIGGAKFQTGIFVGGAGVLLIGLILNSSANNSLKKAISIYNQNGNHKVSFSPLFYQSELGSNLGVRIKF